MSLSLRDQLLRRKPIVFQHQEHKGEELARTMSTFQLTMFGVGATIGTGIFFVLSVAIPKAGAAVLISFLLAAIAAGLSALCYAEMSSSIPVSGSTYSYTYHALGEGAAIIIAACVLLEYGASVSAVAVGWSSYLNEVFVNVFGFSIPDALMVSFVPGPDGEPTGGIVNLPAMILIMMCTLLLLRGASESATVNAIMVMIKLAVLTMFIVIGFSAFQADHFANFFAQASGISAAAGAIFFSFIGLDAVATAGEEVKNPQKALPRAILGALLIVTVFYILVAAAGLAAKPVEFFSTEAAGEAGLSKIMEDVTGTAIWGTILAIGAVISIFSVCLVTLYGQTRILFSVSRDGMISRRFLEVNPKTMTPVFNTLLIGGITMLIAGFVPADYLWDTISIGTLMAFSVVAISVIVMRRLKPNLERPFKVPLYPVVPILTVAMCLYIMSGLPGLTWIIFFSWVGIVFIYYLIFGRRNATLNTYTSDEQIAEPAGRNLKDDE